MKTLGKIAILAATLSMLATPLIVQAQGATGLISVTPFAGTSNQPIIRTITRIVNALLVLAAITATIFVIIGGVRYITSQGDDQAAAAARNTIVYALIGLAVIGVSAVLVNLVLRAFT